MTALVPTLGLEWALANCAGVPEVMYPEPHMNGRSPAGADELDELMRTQEGQEQLVALAVCSDCRIMDDCLEYALTTRERHGVWGGKSSGQRRSILRKQNKGSRTHYRKRRQQVAA